MNYADQRYYATTTSRFMTADPYEASVGASDPGSWNRYAYVVGDPVNLHDPEGLYAKCPEGTMTSGDGKRCVIIDILEIRHRRTYNSGEQEKRGKTLRGGRGGGGIPSAGIQAASSGLSTIASGSFKAKKDCNDFFAALAASKGGNAEEFMDAAAWAAGYSVVRDGPSSNVDITDPWMFGNSSQDGSRTVSEWFQVPGREGLSPQNSHIIYLDLAAWETVPGLGSKFAFNGTASSYGLGTLLHELLHKTFVGGVRHDDIS